MSEQIKVLYRSGKGEYVEKKSRFLAFSFPVTTEEEALEILAAHKKEYWDARHNCYAYVLGEDSRFQRYSDDGEPAGTAGRPILDVLLGEGVCDCLMIVTRYFGGTLLGTGGLVRAYQKSSKACLADSVLLEKQKGVLYTVECDYTTSGKLSYILANEQVPVLDTRYGALVETDIVIPDTQAGRICSLLTDASAGKAKLKKDREVTFGSLEGRTILL